MAVFRRTVLVCAAALLLSGAFAGCSSMPWNEAARNIENSKRLRVGMTKSEVLGVMGDPVSDELFSTPDVWYYFIQTVWMDALTPRLARRIDLMLEQGALDEARAAVETASECLCDSQTVWMDGLTTEDECMPLVFEDGRLVGWGNPFYTQYRIEKKKGGKKLEL